jgi:hypothetical protein
MHPEFSSLTFTRESRSGGAPHVVSVSADDLCPEPCTCPAGQNGRVCWASLEVGADYDGALRCLALERIRQAEGLVALTAACRVYGLVVRRRAKAAAEIARREHLELDPDVRWFITSAGRDALARATAEAQTRAWAMRYSRRDASSHLCAAADGGRVAAGAGGLALRPHTIRAAFAPDQAERLRALLHQSPRAFGRPTSWWTLALAAQVSCDQGRTAERVSGETIRATLARLGVGWKRAKRWLVSPDPAYAREKARATG